MSELINNRQEKLKQIIKSIHEGKSLEEAKKEFKKHFNDVSTEEITRMEQALIQDGMAVEEIQKLCDIHAEVFKGSISDIHKKEDFTKEPGHPLQVLIEENDRIEKLINEEIKPYLNKTDKTSILMLRVAFDRLMEIDKHYKRKELLMFPFLEKKGINGPPKVMWGVDDEIRAMIKEIIKLLSQVEINFDELNNKIIKTTDKVLDMVFKENNILSPLLSTNLDLFNWIMVDLGSDDIGYFLEAPKVKWNKKEEEKQEETISLNNINFNTGKLSLLELTSIINTLPFDMTFVDKNGYVKFFSEGKKRIFERPKTILGRHVTMCHPPGSVHVVEAILNSFINNEKDVEDFWIPFKNMFVLIRYFAIRDKDNNYLGCLELTLDIKPYRDLEGEKRILE